MEDYLIDTLFTIYFITLFTIGLICYTKMFEKSCLVTVFDLSNIKALIIIVSLKLDLNALSQLSV